MESGIKKEIREVLEQTLVLLNDITVTGIRDCRRKVLICDSILGVIKVIDAMKISEKKEEADEDTGIEG